MYKERAIQRPDLPDQAYENLLDQIPVEILGDIFLQCLPPITSRPRRTTAPLLLCQVSRHWRQVAVSLPSLWSTVAIECFGWGRCRMKAELLHVWLKRSAEVPLDISVEVKIGEFVHENLPHLSEIMRAIVAQMHRWKFLRLIRVPSNLLMDLPSTGAPLLREAIVQIHSGYSGAPQDLALLFQNSPLLHSLTWQLGPYSAFQLFPILPWFKLSFIHFECLLSIANCYDILSRSPNLQSCYFESVSVNTPDLRQLSTSPIILAFLHSFRIEASVNILPLLRTLTFPVLSSLVIESTGLHSRAAAHITSEIPNLLHRSNSPPLQTFVLENFGVEEKELIECLILSPKLEALVVCDESTRRPNLTDKVIRALAVRKEYDDDTMLCPELKILKLTGRVQSTDGEFVNMIRQRWKETAVVNGVACLKEVQVEFGSPGQTHELDISGLKQLRSDGLLARAFFD